VAGLAPGPYWLDSSEFAAAAFELGIAHPPGHPLEMLVGKALALVPLGSVALRVGLASALCGAAAAALVALAGAEAARRVGTAIAELGKATAGARGAAAAGAPGVAPLGAGPSAIIGLIAGLLYCLGHAAVLQAIRPEVYALHALLVAASAWALLRFDDRGDRRFLYAAAFAIGLNLG